MYVQDPRTLLLEELGRMYNAEVRSLELLRQLQTEVQSSDLRNVIANLVGEVQLQIRAIQECAEAIGEQLPRTESHLVEGLQRDHQDFLDLHPSRELAELNALGTVDRLAHLQVASYEFLVELARAMKMDQCAALLEENLHQGQRFARRVQHLDRELGRRLVQTR